MEWLRPPFRISDAPDEIDLDFVHQFLASSYWARGISKETVERSIRHALVFGLYRGGRPIGFARAVTDRATFAYLADVFVSESERGQGLGAWLVETVLQHPELRGLRRWMLATRDAHALYRRFGFGAIADPSIMMAIHDPDIYTR